MKLNAIARSLAVASVLAVSALASVQADAAQTSGLTAEAVNRYFIFFNEPGALNYQGGDTRFARTANEREGMKFDANRSEVRAYRDHLDSLQSQRIAAFEGELGRSLDVSYRYDVLHNAIVIENLSASEADKLAAHPDVRMVEIVRDYELATDRVSEFLGAGDVWDGTSTPSGNGYRGQGMVIGIIDTGINAQHTMHGAFNNDASCGFDGSNPKVIAAKDCINSATCTGPNPSDTGHSHGSHVASTAAGNDHVATGGDLSGTRISGVAPCAQIISYKACPDNGCNGAALVAARQQAIIDGVDAVNYSISGGLSPWSVGDADRDFLDMINVGIFVAAAAGNTTPSNTNPIGQVNHRGPWVMTVANSTHDRISSNAVSLSGGPQNLYGLKGEMTIAANVVGQVADSNALGNLEGCNPGFTAGSMTGRVALIRRGSCNFSEKINNAQAAGAVGVIIYNNNPGQPPIVMGQTAGLLPSVMVSNADGLAIQSHVGSNPTSQATISSTTVISADPAAGDILSAGSLRGPIGGNIEVTAPDITAPGTNIFGAYNNTANHYDYMSGTSMASPHVAGAGALLKGLHPTWSVIEVKSALQLTAKKAGFKDFVNGTPNTGQWDADDVGNGRVDLTKAALSGLVLNETGANFLGAAGNQANQRALNLPSMRNTSCTPSCTFTRTVRNTLDTATSWTASGANLGPGLSVSVAPTSFSFTGNTSETQVLTVTVTPNGNQTGALVFGEVNLVEAGGLSPDLRMTVAIRGQGAGGPPAIQVDPTSISGNGTAGSGTPVQRPLNIINAGASDLTWSESTIVLNTRGGPSLVWDQPQAGNNGIVSAFSTTQSGGAYTAGQFVLAADTELTQIRVFGFDNSNTLAAQPTITWVIYADAGDEPAGNPQTNPGPALWTFSTAPNGTGVSLSGTGEIDLNLVAAGEDVQLSPGTYWITVFPTYNNNITGAADPRWAWFQADVVGTGSKLIAPNLFGNITTWTLTGAGGLGTAINDVAFQLTGLQGAVDCGAPWLSMNPTAGTVGAGQSQGVMVLLNASALAEGTYNANLCIDSNDPVNPSTVVPVTFNVGEGTPTGDADLALTMIDIPDPVSAGDDLHFLINVANFGPDSATDVEVEIELPAELSFASHVSLIADKLFEEELRGSSWACAPSASTVTCVLSGTLVATGMAPTLEIITTVSASAAPGTISTTAMVSSNEDDPVPGNNSATVQTEIVGLPDVIFANDFECAAGLPDCPDVDPNLVVIDGIDFVPAPDFTGGSIQWVDGDTCACDTTPYNLNVYGTASTVQFFWPNNANGSEGGVSLDSSTYAVLGSGATVGPASDFLVGTPSAATAPWSNPGNADGYLGFRFLDGGITKYGYAHITTGANGRPFTIHSIVYNNIGDPVTIP